MGDPGVGLCTFSNSSSPVSKIDSCRPDRKSVLLFLSNPGVFFKPRGKSDATRRHCYVKLTSSCYDNYLIVFRYFLDL